MIFGEGEGQVSGGVGKCPGRSSMRGGGWTARTEFKWPPCGARRSAAAASAVDERCATEVIDQRNIAQGGRADEPAMYGRDYRSQSPDGRTEGRRAPWPVYRRAGDRMHGARHAADTATTTTTSH